MPSSPVQLVKANDILHGTVLVTVPHFDDEVLGCGGTLAALAEKSKVHVVYATSGIGSENFDLPGVKTDPSVDLPAVRKQESLDALKCLGIPADRARFLNAPDRQVKARAVEIRDALAKILDEVNPDVVLAPFRYDRHPDHVALSEITRSLLAARNPCPTLLEYFVYSTWRMLPAGDVRSHVRQPFLMAIDTSSVADVKRRALLCFKTQCTVFFPWQTKPVLSEAFIQEIVNGPEYLLKAGPATSDSELFNISPAWIRFAHFIEPRVKRRKEQLAFWLRRKRGTP